MIVGFADKLTERLWRTGEARGVPPDVVRRAVLKLGVLDKARSLDALRDPPGNRLEPMKGDRRGQHSIRVNDQWRLCFIWTERGPDRVEFVDYHQ